MDNLECPSCHQKSVPVWRKLCLGPAVPTTCANCGSRIGVPWVSMLEIIPLLIAFVAAQVIGSLAVGAVIVVVGMLTMAWIHYKFVPLVVK